MENIKYLIESYKSDPTSVFNTWFINNNDRLKAFRSIKRGVQQVIEDIKTGVFPNDFKDSSLEFILSCVTEQKEIFEGAAHPFYWKPKLRIPDIYENQENKRFFGQFLEGCLWATNEESIIKEILRLDERKIKGLGPAVANILYFLHPTSFPPFNTAIVNGYNTLFLEKRKLGSWVEYLSMREMIFSINETFRKDLSSDLGAIGGLLFEIGSNKLIVDSMHAERVHSINSLGNRVAKKYKQKEDEQIEEDLHTEMQYHLLKIGTALGYNVLPASNDKSKVYKDQSFHFMTQAELPPLGIDRETENTIRLIDVIWFSNEFGTIVSAFEVEKSTSIYSGILRLTDLYYSLPEDQRILFIIIPDKREKDVILQLNRPSIKNASVRIHYILFSELRKHCDALCKFGVDYQIMKKISKTVD